MLFTKVKLTSFWDFDTSFYGVSLPLKLIFSKDRGLPRLIFVYEKVRLLVYLLFIVRQLDSIGLFHDHWIRVLISFGKLTLHKQGCHLSLYGVRLILSHKFLWNCPVTKIDWFCRHDLHKNYCFSKKNDIISENSG